LQADNRDRWGRYDEYVETYGRSTMTREDLVATVELR
jgi:hypothetical protein